eukprot:1931445-Pyramimonas_sp.AAC.1
MGALWDCLLLQLTHKVVSDGLRMGQQYRGLTTDEGRKDLGPPHLHISGFIIPTLVKMQALPGDTKATLDPFAKLMTVMDRAGMIDL